MRKETGGTADISTQQIFTLRTTGGLVHRYANMGMRTPTGLSRIYPSICNGLEMYNLSILLVLHLIFNLHIYTRSKIFNFGLNFNISKYISK